LCWDRQQNKSPSEIPACSKTCPPKAILFGERADLLAIAKDRIAKSPDKYFNYIYGEEEAGGTQVLFISSQNPQAIGFPKVEKESYPGFTWEFLSRIPYEIVALGALLAGTYTWRSNRIKKKALEEASVPSSKGGSH
jgi:formate dehydrogenase iron-sulfur subunit